MRTTWLLAGAVLSFFVGESCGSSRAAAINPQELLVVLPLATAVERSTNTVAYRVNEAYPAAETTQALVDALTAKSCVLLPDDPFNPPPGMKLGAWDDFKLKDGGTAKIWSGGWQCKGGVVIFSLISQHEGDPVKVGGEFATDEQVKQIRKMTHTVRKTYGR